MKRAKSKPGKAAPAPSRFDDVQWLRGVREVRHSLDINHPIWVREVSVRSGQAAPEPTVPFPEQHPFCELNISLGGLFTQFVGDEKAERRPGQAMLLGPGVPHYAMRHSYPHHTVTIYFLPLVLFQMGPGGDGAWLLSRFTAPQRIDQRIVILPEKLRRPVRERAIEMVHEFHRQGPGSQLRLWSCLVEMLVELLRWETSTGRWKAGQTDPQEWAPLERGLRYIHEHFAEPIYIDQVAAAIGLTPNRLRDLFRQTLGMSCSSYIQSLRIAEAKARLCAPDAQVTKIAMEVGFETLSHFNASFRKLTGMSPTTFIHSLPK